MIQKVDIDFETRSRAELKDVGEWRYSRDPSTSVLSLAYRIDGGPMRTWCPRYDSPAAPLELVQAVKDGATFEAHNYFFEYCIWRNVLHKRFKWPDLPVHLLTCTAAKASAQGLPRRLEHAAYALRLKNQKDKEGHAIMLQLSRPKKDGSFDNDPEKFERLLEYNIQDVAVEEELSSRLRPLNPTETRVFALDQKMSVRGVPLDVELITKMNNVAEIFLQYNVEKIAALTNGEVTSPTKVKNIREWLASHGLDLPDLREATVTAALLAPDLDPAVRDVLQCRRDSGKVSIKKLPKMLECVDFDGRIRGILVYHGAHTGRYAGKLIQPQNFPRGTIGKAELKEALHAFEALPEGELLDKYGAKVLDVIAALLRSTIKAPPGHKLIASDFSAIEPRVLFWLAGEEGGLKIFRSGEDIYVETAAQYYQVPRAQVVSGQRQFGKVIIIACGYQMGWKKFLDTCKTYGITIAPAEAKAAVEFYRQRFEAVKNFWRALERAFIEAVDFPGRVVKLGKLAFQYKREAERLSVRLPSGRLMVYNRPTVEMYEGEWGPRPVIFYWGVDAKTKQWTKIATYGGRVAENLVQAVSRDFMAEAMLRVEDADFPVILTVHDEVVSETTLDKSMDEFTRLMLVVPEWGRGCPIKVESWEGERYKK